MHDDIEYWRAIMVKKAVHILRYGTVAEKAHLEKAISAYDYLSINGNTAAYVSTAIAKFIVDKFLSKSEKGFFIDPITYAFQGEIRLLKSKSKTTGEEKIKKSIEKLIEIYQYPVTKVKDDIPVIVTDFAIPQVVNDFCNRILSFQYTLVHDHLEKNDLCKYLEYITDKDFKELCQLRPKFLIAPYFYLDLLDSNFDQWLDINRKFVNIAAEQSQSDFAGLDIFAQIVINKNVLKDKSAIQKIATAYENTPCNGITIWVDDLNEHEASLYELYGFIDLLKALKQKPVYNMYGGYFSILLTNKSKDLLDGVSHGLEYGESRKVYPVGGGIPVSKYYYLPLHQRLDFTKAFYLLEHNEVIDTALDNWGTSEKYYKDICKCPQCKEVIKKEMINFIEFESREFYEVQTKKQVLRRKKASTDTKKNCLYHYLLCKKMEFIRAKNQPIDKLIDELEIQKQTYITCDAIQDADLVYLDNWISALKH